MPPSSSAITKKSPVVISGTSVHGLDEEVLIPLLAKRSFHLPGYNWRQDWMQWFKNNHILFGICFHHPLHPLETWERLLMLTASISFGLVATNLVYQLDGFSVKEFTYDRQGELWTFDLSQGTSVTVSQGTVLLWTLGGLCHSIFDYSIWNIMACACCHPGGRWGHTEKSERLRDCGSYALIPLILGLLASAIFLTLLRASEEENEENAADGANGDDQNGVDIEIHDWRSFSFLSQNAIELALTWLVYFPLLGSLVFSGILGCNGFLPVLGGRPRDIKLMKQQEEEEASNNYASI